MNLKFAGLLFLSSVLLVLMTGCGVDSEPLSTPAATKILPTSTPTLVSITSTNIPTPTATFTLTKPPSNKASNIAKQTPLATTSDAFDKMLQENTTPTSISSMGEKTSESLSDKPSSKARDRMFINPEGKRGVFNCTEDNTRSFTSPIVDPDILTDIEPMGKMASSHPTPTDHLYVHWSQPAAGVTEYVMAPADGQIVKISRSRDTSPRFDSSINVPDYRMVIMHSCAFFTIFIHLGELAPEIIKETGPIPVKSYWYTTENNPVYVKAGDPLSKLNGKDGLDWSVHDADVLLTGFIEPDHYIGEPWKVHTVDPFQYYEEPLRSELMSPVIRKAEPIAGKIDYDIEGTIVGNWFLEGTNDYDGSPNASEYWEGHLTLAYGYIDPTQIRISLGFDSGIDDQQFCNVCFGAYGVRDNKPDPASIGPAEGLVKYELMSRQGPNHEQVGDTSLGTFLVQHLGNRTLKVEFVLGKTPVQLVEFSDNATIYKR